MFKRSKVVMLPTNEKAHSGIVKSKDFDFLTVVEKWSGKNIPQHLYILSDEEIKEGDWVILLDSLGNVFSNPQQYNDPKTQHLNDGLKKIIATTDKSLTKTNFNIFKDLQSHQLPQPSDSFIQKYVEEYNKGNVIEEVMVEYQEVIRDNGNHDNYTEFILKINPKDNTITIRKVKDLWNREEVEALLHKATLQAMEEQDDFDFWEFVEENL